MISAFITLESQLLTLMMGGFNDSPLFFSTASLSVSVEVSKYEVNENFQDTCPLKN